MNKVKNIWIVDDDPIFQMIFKMMVEKVCPGKEIRQFGNGQEAIDAIIATKGVQDELPDIIFLDINMPVKTGWDFLNELPEIADPTLRENMRIYIVSSSINPEDQEKADAFAMVLGYLIKPVTETILKSITG